MHWVSEDWAPEALHEESKGTSMGLEGPVQSSVEKTSATAAELFRQEMVSECAPCTVHPGSCATV